MLSSFFSVKLLKFVKLSPLQYSLVLCKHEKLCWLTSYFDFCCNTWEGWCVFDRYLYSIYLYLLSKQITTTVHVPGTTLSSRYSMASRHGPGLRTSSLVARDILLKIIWDLRTLKGSWFQGVVKQGKQANSPAHPGRSPWWRSHSVFLLSMKEVGGKQKWERL